ncbi:ribonuclease H-like domain-containing protein [Tanacetum coccineum]|uniref:Ribonuclease H-like domain-containing protein n=1 Tax=Tanacetum coccineum TaxID=301880 RepID=A0ABQ4Y8B4_9ASTR
MHDLRETLISLPLKRYLGAVYSLNYGHSGLAAIFVHHIFFGCLLSDGRLGWVFKETISPFLVSSAEAEYRGVANAVAEDLLVYRNLLARAHTSMSTATLVYCYQCKRLVYLSSNPVQHQRTKHIEIDIHFVRDLVAAGHIRVLHVPSRYQYADVFTKGLPTVLFDEFRSSLSVRSSPAQTARGC